MKVRVAEAEVAAIAAMSNTEVKQAWERTQDTPAPAITPTLLARDLAHQVQLTAAGGIGRHIERRLRELVDRYAGDVASCDTALPRLGAGSQLLREWGGQTHRVVVEPDGTFSYADKRWRSLSAIARAITGARWSGPRFFGTGS